MNLLKRYMICYVGEYGYIYIHEI